MRYTVIWSPATIARLAVLWDQNVALQNDITAASDEIDRVLATSPERFGKEIAPSNRQLVQPPLAILFRISPDDRRVNIYAVKFWDD